jgi:3-methyladenine DNA glycosylase AlkD
MQKCLTYEDIQRILPYIKTRQWWDTIDAFDKIIGDIGLKDDRVDDLMLEWSLSDDIWLRRIAIDHQLGRKEKTNTILKQL